MKFTMYLNIISFYFHLAEAKVHIDAVDYILLIKWIRNYYTTSTVFIIHPHESKDFDGFQMTQWTYVWSRLLQHENVPTLSNSYENMLKLTQYYNTLRPLVIVFIPSPEAMYKFSNSTKLLQMSSFAWFVIFIPLAINMENKYCSHPDGNPFNLLFDTEMLVLCYDNSILREWYSVDGENTDMDDLIKWYPDRHLLKSSLQPVDLLTNLSLYERRKDLRGKVLRAVTVKNSIFVQSSSSKLRGYFKKTITDLENALNFTIDIVKEVRDHGSFNLTTKRWSGALSLVASREVDIGLSDFSMTNVRLNYADYTVPIITTRSCLYMKQPQMFVVKWFAYYKTFSFALWMSMLMIIIIAEIVLIFIKHRLEESNIMRIMNDEFLRIWGIFCQQGIEEFPRNSSLRIAYCTMLFTAVVISAAYSGSLISFVAARIHDQPFRSINEFINDGTYSVIVTKGTADYDMLIYSNDTFSKNMRKLLKPPDYMPVDINSGFSSVCDDPKLALYISYIPDLRKRLADVGITCRLSRIDFGRIDSVSLILTKNNQYTSIFNYYLQKLLSIGLLNRFKMEENLENNNKFHPVSFNSIVSVLIVFGCGFTLAFLILIVEMCFRQIAKYYDDNEE